MDTRDARRGLVGVASMIAHAVLVFGLGEGCSEAVSLGSQCPGRVVRCDQMAGDPSADPDGAVHDASTPPWGGLDSGLGTMPPGSDASADATAGATTDASGDASGNAGLDGAVLDGGPGPQFPALRNGSFELTRGRPGELAYSPIDPLPLGTTLAEPWGACRTGFSALESSQGVLPRDGAVFVQADLSFIGVSGLRQTLDTPMRGGTRYGFAIDLRASAGADLALQVSASQIDCVAGVWLADSGRVSDQGWQRACISFVPLIDTPQILLQPVARGLGNEGRLFFDNLRADPSCTY